MCRWNGPGRCANPARCPTCRISFATFRATGRFGCPNCYEHFLPQVKELVTRYQPAILWGDGDWMVEDSFWKSRELLAWPETRARYRADTQSYQVRGQPIRVANRTETLAKTPLQETAEPRMLL